MPYQFISQAILPTEHGTFDIHAFENSEGQEHIMLTVGLPLDNTTTSESAITSESDTEKLPIVRIHSECLTGDAFSSLKCDCGSQLNETMKLIQQHGCGAILYLRQEGRGIGLVNKVRAYALQDQGHDTLEANLLLGFPADARTYEMCKPMLDHVNVSKVRLVTNNPDKISHLTDIGIEVVERLPILVGVNQHNSAYLSVKRDRMGHLIDNDIKNKTLHKL